MCKQIHINMFSKSQYWEVAIPSVLWAWLYASWFPGWSFPRRVICSQTPHWGIPKITVLESLQILVIVILSSWWLCSGYLSLINPITSESPLRFTIAIYLLLDILHQGLLSVFAIHEHHVSCLIYYLFPWYHCLFILYEYTLETWMVHCEWFIKYMK